MEAKCISSWLIAANTNIYDVFGALAQAETYWPMNAKISVGDVVYIYLAAPHKQIGFACDVLDTGYEMAKIIDHVAPFIIGDTGNGPSDKPFMKLKATRTVTLDQEGELSLPRLRENGLTGMLMGARRLDNNPALWAYIKRVLT